MKVAGVVLIVMQVMSIVNAGIPVSDNFMFYLGFFLPGTIGALLLIAGFVKGRKKDL